MHNAIKPVQTKTQWGLDQLCGGENEVEGTCLRDIERQNGLPLSNCIWVVKKMHQRFRVIFLGVRDALDGTQKEEHI